MAEFLIVLAVVLAVVVLVGLVAALAWCWRMLTAIAEALAARDDTEAPR